MAVTNKKINYQSRNFADVKTELSNFIKQYYPALFSDFNDSSVGSMLIDLNAAVSDMLSFHTDRMFNETQIDYAQERRSVLAIARTLGLNIPGKRPAITLVDFSVTIEPNGSQPNWEYSPILKRGAQVVGGGQTFELLDDIDFSSGFSAGGNPNRLIIPIINANQQPQSYTIVKRELVVGGITKIFKKVVTTQDSVPFLEVVLPDNNVVSVEQTIALDGTNFTKNPTIDQFLDLDNQFFEVESLAEDKVFVDDGSRISDNSGIIPAKWLDAPDRFTKEYTDRGFCKLTFGSGIQDQALLDQYITGGFNQRIGDFINTMALGTIPRQNTTMFVRYRVGGGSTSNVGPNTLNGLGLVDITVNGPTESKNRSVRNSLKVNNPIPALGGADEPSIEQIRQYTKYNFSSQNRAVTLKDYLVRINQMPGQYGVPFRVNVEENQNKVNVFLLGLDQDSKLTNTSTSTMKENIATYLADYRMMNDYVLIQDGRIINIGFEIQILMEKAFNESEVSTNVANVTKDFLNINKKEMGENIYLGQLIEKINNVGGVLNVIDIRAFQQFNTTYSIDPIEQPYITPSVQTTCDSNVFDIDREIDLLGEFTLFGVANSMFEIKYPGKDISVCVKTAQ